MTDEWSGLAEYERLDSLSEAHVLQLCGLYANEYWTKGRTADEVRVMLSHTDVVVAIADSATDELVAFARILTDEVYRAFVFDVIVRASHRGRGLGKMLMDAVVTHPRVRAVRKIELYCKPQLAEFYGKWGFRPPVNGVQLLVRRPDDV